MRTSVVARALSRVGVQMCTTSPPDWNACGGGGLTATQSLLSGVTAMFIPTGYASFVCISAYANVYVKTTIIKQNIKIIIIVRVPSSQALPGFLITAPPSVFVLALLRYSCVDSNPKKKKKNVSSSSLLDTSIVAQ